MDFENPTDAQNAVTCLQAEGVLAQFAKLPQVYLLSPIIAFAFTLASLLKINTFTFIFQQEQDPTNLYFSGLPREYDEKVYTCVLLCFSG